MARKPRNLVNVDTSLLSAAEIEKIQRRAHEAAIAELKAKQEEELYEATLEAARRAGDPNETLYLVVLNLAPHAQQIMVDHRVYFHGQTVQVPYGLKCVLKDMIARTWEHEEEVGGVNRDRFRPSRGLSIHMPSGAITMNGGGGVTTAARLAGGLS